MYLLIIDALLMIYVIGSQATVYCLLCVCCEKRLTF